MLVDLGLYLADGSESLAETGPFGASRSGAVRIAERVGYELLLESASVTGRTRGGTDFAAAVRGSTTNLDVASAFSGAARRIIDTLAAEERPDAAPEECVAAIFLTRLVAQDDTLGMEVAVVTCGGGLAKQFLTVDIPPEE